MKVRDEGQRMVVLAWLESTIRILGHICSTPGCKPRKSLFENRRPAVGRGLAYGRKVRTFCGKKQALE